MSISHQQNIIRAILQGAVLGMLLSAQVVFAQNDSSIEEVIVIGELSRAAVEAQIIAVEEDIFQQFNDSNARLGTTDLNIECRRETPTGTHFPQRICEPLFLTKERQRNNRDFAADLATRLTPQQLQAQLADKYDEMNAAYAKLIQQDQKFAEVVGILAALQARLEQLK